MVPDDNIQAEFRTALLASTLSNLLELISLRLAGKKPKSEPTWSIKDFFVRWGEKVMIASREKEPEKPQTLDEQKSIIKSIAAAFGAKLKVRKGKKP